MDRSPMLMNRYFEFLLQGLRIDMELFMKFFRWQRSLRTEGIEGTGGCINNSIALCQRTSFANSSAPFSISSSAVSASKHSFTRAQIGPRIRKQASHLSLLLIRSSLLQGAPAIGKAEEGNQRHL
ncbi:hypothetical protein STEG23_030486 [Scotinomys teguina]